MRYLFIVCTIAFIILEVATFTIDHNYCDAANVFGLIAALILALKLDTKEQD